MPNSSMRAAVLVDVDRIEVRDVPRLMPAPHEVMVCVQAVGLCGTDMHIVSGHANYNRDERGNVRSLHDHPQILGHEIAGIVAEVGSAVRTLRAGARVVIDQGRTCVSEARVPVCEYCVTGDSHQCEHYREHGITGLPGGLAEFITVPAINAVRIESDIAADSAALTEPLGCILHSTDFLTRANSRYALGAAGRDQSVNAMLICGAGPAGLLFVQYLRNVIGYDGLLLVSEPNARKRGLAERYGALAIDPFTVDVTGAVHDLTDGRRLELLIDASGAGEVYANIPGLVRKQGTVLMYGHGHAGEDLSVLNGIQFLEPTLISPAGASGGHDADGRPSTYVRALRLIEDGVIDVASLITHRYTSLDGVAGAFGGDHQLPEYVKGVVVL
ncbi:MAG: alcohol dehydrogenase catalytic domain-containing protein [bacterium]